jgi:hypothetical protein
MKEVLYSAIMVTAVMMMPVLAQSQNGKQQDIEAIKNMCGCYRITFDYAETFSKDTAYEKYDNYHVEAPAEWVFVASESEDRIVLQHILVMNDTIIIKHWSQDWVYEGNHLYAYNSGTSWDYQPLKKQDSDGRWIQRVYQVDDSPRYEGVGTWIHADGKHYWESTAPSPLPRRDYTKRSDYQVMERTNRHEITEYGWKHEQDNAKIVVEGNERTTLVEEKGYNRYYRIDDESCVAGKDWWKNHKGFWSIVRDEWDKVFGRKQNLYLAKKVDDKMLWKTLFELDEKHHSVAGAFDAEMVREDVTAALTRHILDQSEDGSASY